MRLISLHAMGICEKINVIFMIVIYSLPTNNDKSVTNVYIWFPVRYILLVLPVHYFSFIFYFAQFLNPMSKSRIVQDNRGALSLYCAYHVLVQLNFLRYYFYFLPDQAQILLDHFNILDKLWGKISTGFDNSKEFPHRLQL